jgi:hypothetical protein
LQKIQFAESGQKADAVLNFQDPGTYKDFVPDADLQDKNKMFILLFFTQ